MVRLVGLLDDGPSHQSRDLIQMLACAPDGLSMTELRPVGPG